MGWYSIYSAIIKGENSKSIRLALKTNIDPQRAFHEAVIHLSKIDLPKEKTQKHRVIYWFKKFGYTNPYKKSGNGTKKTKS